MKFLCIHVCLPHGQKTCCLTYTNIMSFKFLNFDIIVHNFDTDILSFKILINFDI
jgi:hypothetical protein